jgi:hypothetical protein
MILISFLEVFCYIYFYIWELNVIYERRAVGQLCFEGSLSFLKHLGILSYNRPRLLPVLEINILISFAWQMSRLNDASLIREFECSDMKLCVKNDLVHILWFIEFVLPLA